MMRKVILAAFAALAAVSCTRALDEPAVRVGGEIRFVVGDFPVFGVSQTRAVGTEDPGKTEWEVGDELLVAADSKTLGAMYATFTYSGSEWKLTSGELAYKEDEVPTFNVYYAPDYEWVSGKLGLKEGNLAGTGEYIEGLAQPSPNGEEIYVSFSDATRSYSRLRIATLADVNVSVSVEYFTPAGSTPESSTTYTIHSDAKGNAYLYGTFTKNATVSVKYGEIVLASYTFGEASKSGTSYVLDATVISLKGMTSEDEIYAAAQKIADEVSAGKTRFNLLLDADAEGEVFDGIKYGFMEAVDGCIDLTLMGCEKIPARAFLMWKMLKSVTLPYVTEIGESAFYGCSGLRKVVFGTPLTKVYCNPESFGGDGIFEGLDTDYYTDYYTDLVLSGEQKLMTGKEVDGKYVWTPGEQAYKNHSDHLYRKFLGYNFKSVTCGDRTY